MQNDSEQSFSRRSLLKLIGASAGALVAGLVLIPLFGVGMTCALVAFLAVSALIATFVAGWRGAGQ